MATKVTPNERGGATKRERTRQRVREATLALILEGVTYDELTAPLIAERAGIGTATFYQAIRSKAAVVGSLFEEAAGEICDLECRSGSEIEALLEIIRGAAMCAARSPLLARAYHSAYHASFTAAGRSESDSLDDLFRLTDTTSRLSRTAVIDHALPEAFALAGFIEGITMSVIISSVSGSPENWRRVAEKVQALILSTSRSMETSQ